jgi:hypothetical protein
MFIIKDKMSYPDPFRGFYLIMDNLSIYSEELIFLRKKDKLSHCGLFQESCLDLDKMSISLR